MDVKLTDRDQARKMILDYDDILDLIDAKPFSCALPRAPVERAGDALGNSMLIERETFISSPHPDANMGLYKTVNSGVQCYYLNVSIR